MKIYRKLTELIGATPLLELYGPEKTETAPWYTERNALIPQEA